MTPRGLPVPPETEARRRGAPPQHARHVRRPHWGSALRQVGSVLGVSLLVLAVTLLVAVAVLPRVTGWHFVIVAGGSMEPTIPLGSVAVMHEVSTPGSDEPNVGLAVFVPGEIIEYRSPETGQVTTHRIVSVVHDATGGLSFETRGDANNAPDRTPVPVENILGRYEFHVPWVGSAITSIRSPWGYATLVLVPGSVLLFLEVRTLFRAWRTSRQSARHPAHPSSHTSSPANR